MVVRATLRCEMRRDWLLSGLAVRGAVALKVAQSTPLAFAFPVAVSARGVKTIGWKGKTSAGELCRQRVKSVRCVVRCCALSCRLSCRSLRRGRENIRVERQDVGSTIFVGVNVMSMHAAEAISDARRELEWWIRRRFAPEL